MRNSNIYHVNTVINGLSDAQTQISDGSWVVARPVGRPGLFYKLKGIWYVVTGRADLIVFTEQ